MIYSGAFKQIAALLLSFNIAFLPACSKTDQAAEDVAKIRAIKEKEQSEKEKAEAASKAEQERVKKKLSELPK
jgi:hypothetical protein